MYCDSSDHDGAKVIAKHQLGDRYLCTWHYEAFTEAQDELHPNGLDDDGNFYLNQLMRQDRDQMWGRMAQDDY